MTLLVANEQQQELQQQQRRRRRQRQRLLQYKDGQKQFEINPNYSVESISSQRIRRSNNNNINNNNNIFVNSCICLLFLYGSSLFVIVVSSFTFNNHYQHKRSIHVNFPTSNSNIVSSSFSKSISSSTPKYYFRFEESNKQQQQQRIYPNSMNYVQTTKSTTSLQLLPKSIQSCTQSVMKSNSISATIRIRTNPRWLRFQLEQIQSITTSSTQLQLFNSNNKNSNESIIPCDEFNKDPYFDMRTTISLIIGQSILIIAALVTGYGLNIPNYGFGTSFHISISNFLLGCVAAIPLGGMAYVLDIFELKYKSLQDVTKATQRSVLTLMGSIYNPILALIISISLGTVAGYGEEMLFRGIIQYELINRISTLTAIGNSSSNYSILLGVGISSILFGLLHSITPVYVILATIASIYFGFLFVLSNNNLFIPIICHTIYDIGALYYAHYTVTHLSNIQQEEIFNWISPTEQKVNQKQQQSQSEQE